MRTSRLSRVFVLVVAAALFALTGCASLLTPATIAQGGVALYSAVDFGEQAMNNEVGTKRGESCRVTYLGFITFDRAPTLYAAAADGNIQEIGSIDGSFTSVLGLFSRRCIVITGN